MHEHACNKKLNSGCHTGAQKIKKMILSDIKIFYHSATIKYLQQLNTIISLLSITAKNNNNNADDRKMFSVSIRSKLAPDTRTLASDAFYARDLTMAERTATNGISPIAEYVIYNFTFFKAHYHYSRNCMCRVAWPLKKMISKTEKKEVLTMHVFIFCSIVFNLNSLLSLDLFYVLCSFSHPATVFNKLELS